MAEQRSESRNGTLAEAIAILKLANLHSWYPGKQELWVGWQNCESMKMDPMQQVIDMLESIAAPSETAFTKEDAAKIVERKARALQDEYCHGDTGPGGYTWSNKEAEWQCILLEELAEEFRNGA